MTADAELLRRVDELSDRAEIQDCMQRYARGIDRQDRATAQRQAVNPLIPQARSAT